jgi:hypothetical protein
LYTVARQQPAAMDRCQNGDLRTRVEISICTGVGPLWRRLIGTLRSLWSTLVSKFCIVSRLVSRRRRVAVGCLKVR